MTIKPSCDKLCTIAISQEGFIWGKERISMTTEQSAVRDDSLIKDFKILESERKIYTNKIVFTTVRDIELTYYTNTKSFVESLENFKGETFVITYATANTTEGANGVEKRIIKVKLPKKK